MYYPVSSGVPYQGSVGLDPYGLSNSSLEWEATKKLQIGLDLGFLKDRLLISAGYARNRSSNQLLDYALPSTTGQSSIFKNFPATIQNIGWEFSLNSANIKAKNFNWSSSVNLTIPRNKLISFPNISSSTYANDLIIGQPLSTSKMYHFLGVDPATGMYIFADADGKPTSSPNPLTDRVAFKNALPDFYGGFQNSLSYKGIQLDILFQFVKQIGPNTLFNNGTSLVPGSLNSFTGIGNQPTSVLTRWRKPGDIASIQRYSTNSSVEMSMYNALSSDASYSNASYIRLKNLSVSYQFPERWKQNIHVQNCRIFLHGQNLITITKYQGIDPETQTIYSLPPLKILTIGLQVIL